MWGAIAASIGKGRVFGHHDNKGRRPGGRRKLTTSQAAIRRAEARKRRTTKGKPARPTGTGRGPRKPTLRGSQDTPSRPRSVNTGPKRPTPKRTTSQAAIARFKAMRGRRKR